MISGPARRFRHDIKAKRAQVKHINEGVNRANRIVIADIIVKTLGKQSCLIASTPSMKRFIIPPRRESTRQAYHEWRLTFAQTLWTKFYWRWADIRFTGAPNATPRLESFDRP